MHGFTINPVTDPEFLKNILRGLGNYKDIHFCDYGIKNTTHKNYLGEIIGGPFASTVKTSESSGLIAHCMLDNGYYTVRVWNNVFPAEIYFDLFIEEELLDTDLIIDHLCAPAVPNDGFGMFDYTFSTSKTMMPSSSLSKFSKVESSYIVNDPVSFIDEDREDWEVVLNQLKSPECHYCGNAPEHWIFIDDDSKIHLNFKSVLVCGEHKIFGRSREISNESDKDGELDYRTSKNKKKFYMKEIVENDTNLFTKNIEESSNE